MNKQCVESLYFRQQLLFSGSCVEMQERSFERRLTVGKQPRSGAWVTGSYDCVCQVHCMLGRQAVAALVGWRDGAGKEGVVVTWCRSVAASHLKLFLKLFSEMWEVCMCHGGLRVCMCFLSSEAWASLLHRSCLCI